MADDAKPPDPLTESELRELVDTIIGAPEFTTRDAAYAARRALCFGLPEAAVVIPGVDIPPAMQWFDPSLNVDGTSYVRRMVGARLTVHVTATKEGRRAEAVAAKIKNYLSYMIADWLSRGIPQPAMFDTATVGLGVLHPIIRPEALPEPPPMDKEEPPAAYMTRLKESIAAYKGNPFDLERIDSRTLYWEADRSIQFQKAEVPVRAVNRIYEARGKSIAQEDGKVLIRQVSGAQGEHETSTQRRAEMVTLISLEDKHWCYRLVYGAGGPKEAVTLDVYPNYFGEPSYVPLHGDLSGLLDALNFSQPWLLGKYPIIRKKNLFGTVLLAAGLRSAQQRYQLRWMGKGDAPGNVGVEDIRVVGELLIPPDGYEIVMPKIELGVDATEALRYMESIDTYGFPREIAHPMEMDAKSGFDRAKATDAVSSLLDAPLMGWTDAARKACLLILHAQAELGLKITVRSSRVAAREPDAPADVVDEITVEADELEDVDMTIEGDATTQYTQIAQAEEHLKWRSEGLYTDTEFLKSDRGVEDTDAWYRLRDRDEVRIATRAAGLQDALTAVTNIRKAVMAKAAARHKLAPGLVDAAAEDAGAVEPMAGMADAGGGDVTASMPTGTGTAQTLVPPIPDEVTQPGYETV